MLSATNEAVIAVPAADAVSVMWDAVARHGQGSLCAPARTTIALGEAAMTLTSGRLPGTASGFRMYSTAPEAQEVTLIFRASGDPLGVITGSELGKRRTGALGGVAAKLCARADARTVGLVGAGSQAFTQLWAIAAVRDIEHVRVFSRNPDTAKRFAERVRAELGLTIQEEVSAHAAVADADIVILSTPAPEPLIDATWIAPGTHVHTLGPKGDAEGECPKSLVVAADLLVSDSPVQLLAMEGSAQPWTGGRAATSLGEILTGEQPGRRSDDDITLYASVGLAGTEVLFAHHILTRSEA
jgi:alanine dehydrogenase